ncbi:uncharacterized protein LOC126818633 [Patella vulgata]|uniref:uncharacterized protein LOC126818633 n=1 Tax=Patella vulgata TaxID=6465 RepID=UPI002180032E|nr:uncharacterized protein LOC126818633 [Patella vulgata]XP_050402112.1 uncharacterized protein LOC126818633 [Patella vulgata]XP_050402113.1 uncharacterized protein LOC126818633 [Patella vulgata]
MVKIKVVLFGTSVLFVTVYLALFYISHGETNLTNGIKRLIQNETKWGLLAYISAITGTQKEPTSCPDILKYMPRGHWKTRLVTSEEHIEMKTFLQRARTQHLLPPSLQRTDGKCGNVTFDNLKKGFHNLLWFRALCDPYGATPCCHQNVCTNHNVSQCACDDCYDMRQTINAEHASWVPDNRACSIPERNNTEMCDILNKMKIIFIGDSFIRHVYLAFLLLLRNNTLDGGMSKYITKGQHDRCVGLYMFTEKECRGLIDMYPSLCNGNTFLQLKEYNSLPVAANISRLIRSVSNQRNTICIIGQGIHDNYDHARLWSQLLFPILRHRKSFNLTWPKIVWAAPHAPGMLKTPRVPEQSHASVIKFTDHIGTYLSKWDIPVFDSFNLTDGVNSFDGAHYGLGVNLIKAKILIEYIRELRSREKS